MRLIETIAENRNQYTKTERLIADYIINNVLVFTVSSIGGVAEELGISKTSLIRFAKKAGFDGYLEFRRRLQEEEVVAFSPAERFRKLIDSKYLSGNEKIERKEIDNIIQCCSKIDEKQLDMLIDRVEKAKKIYTAGSDAASFIAQIMSFRMSIFGYPFMYIDSARVNLAVSMMSAEAEDVLFLFDFPDYNKSYRYVVGYKNYNHSLFVCIIDNISIRFIVILITDYASHPLAPSADMSFYCDSQTDIFKNSLVAPLYFINHFMSAIIYHDEDRMLEYLRRREKADVY